MEIERKFLVKSLPEHLERYPGYLIEQAYLTTNPVIRVRKEILFSSAEEQAGASSDPSPLSVSEAKTAPLPELPFSESASREGEQEHQAPEAPGAEKYTLTYKGSGFMAREEYNLPLTKEAYETLLSKAEGNVITKKRYRIPIEGTGLTVELDCFAGAFAPLLLAEVEFETVKDAEEFIPLPWFGEDVTKDPEYHNSNMSLRKLS